MAAVTSSGSLCFLLISFFQGVFTGASVIISRRFGAKDEKGLEKALHTTVCFALGAGIVLSILGITITPFILKMMDTPAEVLPNSITYFRIYCSGLLGLVLYNTATGIFQALGDTRRPLMYLIISSVINLILDVLFVAVFNMGVAGTSIATITGQFISALLAFRYLMSGNFVIKISLRKLRPDFSVLKKLIHLGFPSGIQNCIISLANVFVQSNINAFGEDAVAGCGSYAKIEAFFFLPVMALNMTITTFISQNLGANHRDRVNKGLIIGALMSIGLAQTLGTLLHFISPVLVPIFSDNPQVIAYGVQNAKIVTFFFGILAFSHVIAAALRGAGRTLIPMLVMLGIWCLLRVLYITVMVRYIPDIRIVFSAYPVTWTVSSIVYAFFLRKGMWDKKSVQKV